MTNNQIYLFLIVFFTSMCSFTAKAQTNFTDLSDIIITSQYNDSPEGEGVEYLIDHSSKTKFLTFHSETWVTFKSPVPFVLSKYTLTSGNDAPNRDPYSWKLEGSNNGVTFYRIETRSNENFSSRGQVREFTLEKNNTAYFYYKFTLKNKSGNILQLSELELFGEEGSIPTEPFADFSFDSYLVTTQPVSFTGACINTTNQKWTFEGGKPSTSTESDVQVVYDNPGVFKVTLEAFTGDETVSKTIEITIKDINDWSSFVYPTVNLTSVNTSNPGYIKYTNLAKMNGFNNIEDFVKNCCLVIAKELYYTVDEANEHNLRTINYKLNEGGSLSYKSGSAPTIEIGFDMNYLNSFSQTHSDEVSADEIYGVLCHELCHGYQRAPRNGGAYAAGTEYFGFIEGMADLARLLTGGFNPRRYPRVGGRWTDGYNTTAFFYQWITNTRSSTFLKDLNRTALTINPWSLNAVTTALFNEPVQSLWYKYQVAVNNTGIENKELSRVTIALNDSKTSLMIHNVAINDSVTIHNLKGQLLLQSLSEGLRHTIDIHDLPHGIYVVSLVSAMRKESIKFAK